MTTIAASSSSCPMPHREASLPPLRSYLFGQQDSPNFSPSAGTATRSRLSARAGEEEDEALPLLVSMYSAQRKESLEPKQLPAISSMLGSAGCPSPAPARPMMTPQLPEARASPSSPVPQPSPSSPSSLSPGLFVLNLSSSSSASSSSFSSPLSFSSPSSPPSSGAVAHHAYASATSSLMELSDIISSMPALQNLPVPPAPLGDEGPPSSPVSLGDEGNNDDDDDDSDYRAGSPVSSRTRRVTRRSRKQQKRERIERIRSELEQERDRARDLERELQLALQERAELLQLKGDVPAAAVQAVDNSINAASGLSFLNVLSEQSSEGGGSRLAFAHLPRANSLPSFLSGFAADADVPLLSSSEELGLRSRSAPMLPPIGSIPALSPYLKRKRASLPAGADSGARRSLSPVSSPLRPSTRVSFSCGDSARPNRRRRLSGYGEEEDQDYEPTPSASSSKKAKRSRSISEGGRRLTQAGTSARDGRRRSHQQLDDYAAGYDAEAAAAFIVRRARAIEDHSSRASMDVVEGADQEDDDGSATTTTTTTPTTTVAEFPRRDSVLCFMKDHPHASFWLSRGKARN